MVKISEADVTIANVPDFFASVVDLWDTGALALGAVIIALAACGAVLCGQCCGKPKRRPVTGVTGGLPDEQRLCRLRMSTP